MTPFQSELCWEAQLERMLDDQKPEDAHLDYKGIESLLPSGKGGGGLDKQKRAEDISKDVSSFLNLDGGLLVYGVPESEDPSRTGGSPIPGGPEIGFQRGEVTKETIDVNGAYKTGKGNSPLHPFPPPLLRMLVPTLWKSPQYLCRNVTSCRISSEQSMWPIWPHQTWTSFSRCRRHCSTCC